MHICHSMSRLLHGGCPICRRAIHIKAAYNSKQEVNGRPVREWLFQHTHVWTITQRHLASAVSVLQPVNPLSSSPNIYQSLHLLSSPQDPQLFPIHLTLFPAPQIRLLLATVHIYKLYLLTWRPSVHWRCWLGGRKGIRPVKHWSVGCWRG